MPSTDALILLPMGLAAGALWARGRWFPAALFPRAAVPTRAVTVSAATGAAVAFALLTSETIAYKLGIIAIFFVGSVGLHILVNWAGELSLAHAAFLGMPAFAVAQVSSHSRLSPILLLPLGIVIGALLGLVVAVAALRARGLQVSLVTLAVGIAIDRFFFVRSWVIGSSGGIRVPVPSLFGTRIETNRGLLPVLAVVVVVVALAARAILRSKVGRALSLVKANPDAAAAVGIPVAAYRGIVYMLAGGFAGLAGALYVVWVQRVSPNAFPLQLGFTYLVIAVLAGKGGLTGLGLSAVLIEGGQLFSIIPQSVAVYMGPVALVYNVTRYQEGFNGVLRELRERLAHRKGAAVTPTERQDRIRNMLRGGSIWGSAIRLPVVIAGVLVAAGFGAMALAWYHAGNTDQLWIQNQEIVSGGLGGLALVVVGSMLLVRDAFLHGRAMAMWSVEDLDQGTPVDAGDTDEPAEVAAAPATRPRPRRAPQRAPQRPTRTRRAG